jgi:TolA-binding protein
MRNVRAVIFISLLLITPTVSLCQVAGTSVAEQQDYSFAVGLYRDGQYPLALQQFKAFLKNYPSSQRVSEITFLAGECLLQDRMYDSALGYYQTTMERFPGSSYFMRSQLRSGEIYLQLDKLDRAEKLLKNVLSNSEESSVKGEASYKLGQLFVSRTDYTNAVKYFDLTYEGYPNSGFADYAMYGTAWCYGKLADFAKSKEVFESLLSTYPDTKLRADAVEKMGECDFFTSRFNDAIAEFAGAIAGTSDAAVQEPALYYQGRSYIALNHPDSAMAVYSEYLRKFPSGDHSHEVRILFSKLLIDARSDIQQALTLLGEIKPSDPLYFNSRIETARAYEASGAVDSAESTLIQLARSSKNENESAQAYFELGKFYFQNKSYRRSQESYLLASKDPGLYAVSMKNAAVSAAAANDYANAKLYFLNAISKLKGAESLNAHFDYAAALYAGGDYEGAAQIYTTASDLAQSDSLKGEGLYMAAESFYRAGDYSKAQADYQTYLKNYPHESHTQTALLGVGYSQYFADDFTSAAQTFRSFTDKYPSSPLLTDAYLRMGDCFYYDKDYQRALSVYQDAANKFSGDTSSAYAWYQVGQSYFQMGQFSQALSAFQFVVSKFPRTSIAPDALYAIGWVYFSEKDYADAITNFSKVSDNYPGTAAAARALYSKGDSYYNSGNYRSALINYRELLEKYPTSTYVDNAIVGMQYCLTVMGQTEEAESVIDNFVRDHPDLPNVDRIYYKKVEYALNQKKFADAEKYLREFMVKFPQSGMAAKALYNLALVEIQLGRNSSAMGYLSDLIARTPRTEFTTAAQVKLAEIYTGRKGYDEAGKLLTEAAAAGNEYSTPAQVDLGKLYLLKGDTLEAESNFSKAALSQSDSVNDADKADAKVLLSGIYFGKGRFSDAISLANSVAKTRDDLIGARAQLRVAEYYCASGDSSNAVLAFLRVKYVFTSFADIVAESQLGLASCLVKFGNVSGARSLLGEFIKGRTDDSFTRQAKEQLKKLKSK